MTIFRFYGGGGGNTTVMRGDIELMGVPPVPPTRENLDIFSESTGSMFTENILSMMSKSMAQYYTASYTALCKVHCPFYIGCLNPLLKLYHHISL